MRNDRFVEILTILLQYEIFRGLSVVDIGKIHDILVRDSNWVKIAQDFENSRPPKDITASELLSWAAEAVRRCGQEPRVIA